MPKILIADDSIAVRKVAERLLTEAGLTVTLAANGEEALAYLAKERPDAIVSDVIMPDKSGYEVCAFVRGNSNLAGIPVLLISGIVNDEVTKQADACRADGVLKKPFQGTSLKDRVLELLSKRQESPPAAVSRPIPTQTTATAEKVPPTPDQQQEHARQDSIQVKEMEGQLLAERARSEDLAKRLADAVEHMTRAKAAEAQLAVEQQRVSELEANLMKLEQQASRVSELETALTAEQDAVGALKQEVVNWQKTSGRIAELESALHAEREAAEQLVQQLGELEKASSRLKEVEASLAHEEQQVAELQQKIKDLETELSVEREKAAQTAERLQEVESIATKVREMEELLTVEREKAAQTAERLQEVEPIATKVREMEELLTVERDRNGVLVRRVTETEQAAENATKRFEDMARKLGEIAGLASQLGSGRGQS
ncbi:MAG: response regulator [Nitrospira sp.]